MLKYCIAQRYVEALVRKDRHVVGVNLENEKSLKWDSPDLLIPIFSLAAAREERFNNVESSGIAPISSTAPMILCAQQISSNTLKTAGCTISFGSQLLCRAPENTSRQRAKTTGSACNIVTVYSGNTPCRTGASDGGDSASQGVGLPGTFPERIRIGVEL